LIWRLLRGSLLLANDSNHDLYEKDQPAGKGISRVVGLGIVSAASAIAGGLAMAWWHRKTLAKLQNPIAKEGLSSPKSQEIGPESE